MPVMPFFMKKQSAIAVAEPGFREEDDVIADDTNTLVDVKKEEMEKNG
jgi:hypothetical protein